jgi:hypothetical protein
MIQRAYYGISLNADPATPLIRNKIAIIGTHRRFGSLTAYLAEAESPVCSLCPQERPNILRHSE